MEQQTAKPQIDTTQMAGALVGLMESLSLSMEQEVLCLKKRDYPAMEEARQTKAKLLRDYYVQHRVLDQNPDLLKNISEESRLKLRSAAQTLAQATTKNARELKAAVTATQSLLQTVMDAARRENKRSECYVDTRKDPFMLGSYSPVCDPVAVSRIV